MLKVCRAVLEHPRVPLGILVQLDDQRPGRGGLLRCRGGAELRLPQIAPVLDDTILRDDRRRISPKLRDLPSVVPRA
jgi:hypothetical protein